LSLRPRPEIESLAPAIHGGPNYAELNSRGLSADKVLDFSVCCNPYPPPSAVRESLRRLPLGRYPDSTSTDLKNKLSYLHGIPAENILVGSGTTELIRLITLTYLNKGDAVLLFKPSYGEYETSALLTGAGIIEYKGLVSENFAIQPEKIAALIKQTRARIVFICNPNNPTGQYLSAAEIDVILKSCRNSILVLDEAYINFVKHPWSSLDIWRRGNAIILRSMTKDYGLAGLRLGYMIAAEEVILTLARVSPPWNVNVAAQRAGIAALDCPEFLRQSQIKIHRAGQYLRDELTKLDLPPLPSQSNFFIVKVDDGKRFRTLLLDQAILVRDCASFGLPDYIRIAPRSLQDCRALIKVLKKLSKLGKL